jgi:hypothetical protein
LSASPLLPNSRSEKADIPRILEDVPGRPRLCSANPRNVNRSSIAAKPETATEQPLTCALPETPLSVKTNSHQNSHQTKMATR